MKKEKLSSLKFMIDSAIIRRRDTWDFKLITPQNKKQFEQAYFECVMWLAVATEWFEENAPNLLRTSNSSKKKRCKKCKKLQVVKHKREDINDEYFYLLGIKKIFNCFKHNMELTNLDKIHNELLFTFVDEETQEKTNLNMQKVLWLDIESINPKQGITYTLKDESYVENFANQQIIETLYNAHKTLQSLYQQLLNTTSQATSKSQTRYDLM